MGFDNECIVNIQTLAGEYFCPVCRLLVYPNEAIQSQCTHLYCKPCLAYVVGTTRACPYDGYLVTEQGSKPLLESNKVLAETIGKIPVRCLFYRSGCQWQGPLSDCSSHCSGCAFGNSPVVCNRCAIQIAHRQVQEHAQTCQGVQPQATQALGAQSSAPTVAATPAASQQPQTATQSGTTDSVTKTPQSGAGPATGQDPNLQANANPQVYGATPGAVPTPEQLYQQQYYQYSGYDLYQQAYQNYYPYQQPQVFAQPPQVVQAYPQPQPQQQPSAQSQAPVQSQVPPQPQGPAQSQTLQNINPQYQIPNATQPSAQMMPPAQPPSQGYPHPQSYPGGQPQQPVTPHPHSQPMQMPQFQQPQMQHHPPPHPQAHPQPQTQAHPHQQPMNQALDPNIQAQTQQPLTHAVSGYNSYPQPQTQQQMQMGAQQRPNLHPQSGFIPQLPPHAQGLYPPQHPQMGVPQSAVPNQQFSHQGQVPGGPPVQQAPANPYGQHPGHPAMQPMQQRIPQQHMFPGQASGPVQNQLHPRGQQMQLPPPPPSHPQLHPQVPAGLPPHQHQNYPARLVMPNLGAQSQPFAQSSAGYPGQAQARPPHLGLNQHPANQNHLLKTNTPLQKNESLAQRTSEKDVTGLASASGVGTESANSKNLKAERDAKLGVNEDANTGAKLHKEETASTQPTSNGGKFHEAVGANPKDGADGSQHEKLALGDNSMEGGSAKAEDKNFGQSHSQVQGRNPDFPMQYPPSHQQAVRPPGVPHHAPPNMLRPQGPGHFPHPGQPFNLPPNRPPSEFGGPRMPLGEPTGPFNSSGGFIGQQRPGNEIFPDPRSRYNGQSPGSKSHGRNRKDAVGGDSSAVGMHDGRFNPLASRAPRILDKEPFGGYGGHHMDRFASRSPGRENAGFPPRNFEGRDSRPFEGGPRPFKFPSDPGFMRGSEFQGPRNLPGHLPFNDPNTFGDFHGPARRGDLHAPENFHRHRPFGEEFGGNMLGPNLGDHGFRSSHPPAGGLDPFGNSKNRMLSNNGWCRICKIDCEGVEGLELHSQTREHQEMAMDLVRSIKMQNSKRQKVSNDRSSFEEPSKRRGSGHEIQSN